MSPTLPKWYQAFKNWRDKGGLPKDRPKSLPKRIPAWVWDYYRKHKPKPAPVQETFWHQPAGFVANIVNAPASVIKQEFPFIKLIIVEIAVQDTPLFPNEMQQKLNEYRD